MADNVSIATGAGATVLADEVTITGLGTGVAQLFKLADGTVNGTNLAVVTAAGAQLVSARQDAGRTRVAIVFQGTGGTTDALLSLVKISNGVAAAGSTSVGVASGKTLRLTGVSFGVRANAAAAAFGTLTLRTNPAGATVLASPSELRLDSGVTGAVVNSAVSVSLPIPDGFEYSGAQTIGASLIAQATTNIISVALLGFEY